MKHLPHALALTALALLSPSCSRNGDQPSRPDARTELDHLIIQEIFYVGHAWHRDLGASGGTTEAQLYDEDQYIALYNPTKETQYLDGLALATTALDPAHVVKLQARDEFVGRYFGAGTVVYFPGSGKQYPVAPGARVIIAKYAIDHQADFLAEQREGTEEEGETFLPEQYHGVDRFLDLSKADFEWTASPYLSGEAKGKNNARVPDLLPLVTEADEDGERSARYTLEDIAEQGGLALIRLPWTPEEFARELQTKGDASDYLHQFSVTSTHHKGVLSVFEIPFDHVLDCLTICPQQGYLQRVTKLDKGYLAVTEQPRRTMPKADYPKFAGRALVRRTDGHGYVDEDNTRTDFEVKSATLSRQP